jgi:hypothetical protein
MWSFLCPLSAISMLRVVFLKKKTKKKKNIAKLTKDNLTNFAGLSL